MIKIREIQEKDNSALAKLIRESLKANQLDIPGTAYFDAELDNLSAYYKAVVNDNILWYWMKMVKYRAAVGLPSMIVITGWLSYKSYI